MRGRANRDQCGSREEDVAGAGGEQQVAGADLAERHVGKSSDAVVKHGNRGPRESAAGRLGSQCQHDRLICSEARIRKHRGIAELVHDQHGDGELTAGDGLGGRGDEQVIALRRDNGFLLRYRKAARRRGDGWRACFGILKSEAGGAETFLNREWRGVGVVRHADREGQPARAGAGDVAEGVVQLDGDVTRLLTGGERLRRRREHDHARRRRIDGELLMGRETARGGGERWGAGLGVAIFEADRTGSLRYGDRPIRERVAIGIEKRAAGGIAVKSNGDAAGPRDRHDVIGIGKLERDRAGRLPCGEELRISRERHLARE